MQVLNIEVSVHVQYFEFAPAASADEINEWENQNSITIPQGYKDWLMFSNGSIIHGALAEFYGINKIKIGLADMPKSSVIIGQLTGDGERLCFSSEGGDFFMEKLISTIVLMIFFCR